MIKLTSRFNQNQWNKRALMTANNTCQHFGFKKEYTVLVRINRRTFHNWRGIFGEHKLKTAL